ncbi:hypothetical protein [Primorskyibacter sp. S187A]|uniref:hypothetical protein n=1 Tax=Primorskyibacter sp. S187A TaxID=3415130 RepID=UPI003C7CF0FC
MKTFMVSFLFIAWSTIAASDVNVRSGEHEDFTRLVFQMPETRQWKVINDQAGRSARVLVARSKIDYSSVFERVPRTRLSSISTVGPGEIILEFACNCEAESFTFGATSFVIDIKENETTSTRISGILPLISENRRKTSLMQSIDFNPLTNKGDARTVAENSTEMADARKSLLSELGRAATQGTVSISSNRSVADSFSEQPNLPSQEARDVKSGNIGISPTTDRVNFRIESSIDDALASTLRGQTSSLAEACSVDQYLDAWNWSPEGEYIADLGVIRRSLVNEMGELDPEELVNLAKLKIHYGLGHEAVEILNEFPIPSERDRTLQALGRIIADQETVSYFNDLKGCSPGTLFWAILSGDGGISPSSLDQKSLLLYFEKLPKTLKVAVGPRLANRLETVGHAETAQLARSIANRGTDSLALRVPGFRQEADVVLEDLEGRIASLREIVNSNSEYSTSALIEIIEISVKNDLEVLQPDLELANSFVFELQGSDIEQQLIDAIILGYSHGKLFDKAADALLNFAKRNAIPHATADTFAEMLTNTSDDAVFLSLVFRMENIFRSLVSPSTKEKMANRLEELGLSGASSRIFGDSISDQLASVTLVDPSVEDSITPEELAVRPAPSLIGAQGEISMSEGRFNEITSGSDSMTSASDSTDGSNNVIDRLKSRRAGLSEVDGSLAQANELLEEASDARMSISSLLNSTDVLSQ